LGGNAVVLEVTSETGHATYLFRVMGRNAFATASKESFAEEAALVLRDLNEAIIATGFRREPIYLSEDQLNTPEYSKYLYASEHLAPLKLLRERFFARIIHGAFEQWKTDLNDALLFNCTTKDDSVRWSKSKLDYVETNTSIATPPSDDEKPADKPQSSIQNLNLNTAPGQFMTDRLFTLTRMEGDDSGNVRLCLHDPELDYDAWITLPGDEASKLGAFPGSKLKLTLQK